jgi:uncharacterized protein (DUF885 family)
MKKLSWLLWVVMVCPCVARADELDDLARDFWSWRAVEQPISTDDIPRIERPSDWVPKWSPDAVKQYRTRLVEFESRWKRIDATKWSVARQVDYRLMGSAIARVRWELEIIRGWQKNPAFYVDQTLGAYFHLLLSPPPFDAARTQQIVATLNAVPATLTDARQNLTEPVSPFAKLAIDGLENAGPKLRKSVAELEKVADGSATAGLESASQKAAAALADYREWLSAKVPGMANKTAIGREDYVYFLKNVALLPFTPEQLQQMGRQEWARSLAFETYEAHRDQGIPQAAPTKTLAEEVEREAVDEEAVRRYLEAKSLLTVPSWMAHYRFAEMPAYLSPLSGWERDDFTGPSRLKQNSTRYVEPFGPDMGYWATSMVQDARGEIVHEGVPGHYFQLALSWANPDAIRRHYYDSSANEGIGFYAEEMMLQAGLFDDKPHSRQIIYNFMRLRALRVEVDVKLALGEFTMDQGAEYLKTMVPMDAETAHAEAAFFASTPGQAISYQIGKMQIYKFLADARRKQRNGFDLRAFHDSVWQNGNVPFVLQEWEYLGMKDDVEGLERVH